MSELLTAVVTLVVGAALPLSYLLFGSQRRLRQLERLAAIYSSLPNGEVKESLKEAIGKLTTRVGKDAELAEKQSDGVDYAIAVLLGIVLLLASIVAIRSSIGPPEPLAWMLLVLAVLIILFLVIYAVKNWGKIFPKDPPSSPAV